MGVRIDFPTPNHGSCYPFTNFSSMPWFEDWVDLSAGKSKLCQACDVVHRSGARIMDLFAASAVKAVVAEPRISAQYRL